MAEADLDALVAIDAATPPPSWSREAFAHELSVAQSRPCVLEDGRRRVVGFLVWWRVLDEAHLQNVAVSGACRRAGHGRWLVRALLIAAARAGARRVLLEVRADNAAARSLYAATGFADVGRRRRYYADGEDAVLMARAAPRLGARAAFGGPRWAVAGRMRP